MAEQVRFLGEDAQSDLDQTPQGQHLIQDTQELAQAVDAFHDSIHQGGDPGQMRQAFAGIDASWHHLRGMLAQPGFATPAVARAAARVAQTDAQLHQALGLDVPGNLSRLANEMAEQVQNLGDDIASDVGQMPQGRHLLQDTQELAQSVTEFHDTARATPDPAQVRQTYARIDASWHHLRGMLAQTAGVTPAIARDATQVAQVDAQIHQALGMGMPPADFYGAAPPQAGGGPVDYQRLALAMEQRSQALLTAIQTNMVGVPDGARLVRDAANLAVACDMVQDQIERGMAPQQIPNAIEPIARFSGQIAGRLQGIDAPPAVDQAWQSFLSAEALMRRQLNMQVPPPVVRVNLVPVDTGPSPIVALADQLVSQVGEYIQAFAPNANRIPEGDYMLVDAQRMQAAAVDFRRDLDRGIDPNRLAYEFRPVDECWNRLSRRMQRVAQANDIFTGPNIQRAQQMGQTCRQIHQLLAMPGPAPGFGLFEGDDHHHHDDED